MNTHYQHTDNFMWVTIQLFCWMLPRQNASQQLRLSSDQVPKPLRSKSRVTFRGYNHGCTREEETFRCPLVTSLERKQGKGLKILKKKTRNIWQELDDSNTFPIVTIKSLSRDESKLTFLLFQAENFSFSLLILLLNSAAKFQPSERIRT